MTGAALKRLLVGLPKQSTQLRHQLLPKWMALPVFSSDPLSSTAYATQEMMLVLVLAGTAAYARVLPLSLAVATLLAIVVFSYRQTVRAYPHGGGAYIVARENLGDVPGLTAGSALLIDYTLTVSVSVAAGVAAIASAAPGLADARVWIALGFVALVTLANLRGVRESGLLFATPTYLFVATMLTLIVVGLVRCASGCPQAPSAGTPVQPESTLGLFLLLRAFSSGATALTGVEAISNGVQAFRYPQSRNAATTLGIMGAIAITMFLGIGFLAAATGVVATEDSVRTVNAEIALAVFGMGPGFLLVQIVTAAILILAANTAYADFPRLASVLAADRFLPRQFVSRGDRLVFSNGILLLAGAASLLLVIFGADVTRLIQLYVVGVFTSFTLSQLGMVLHHRRVREPKWQRGMIINGIGALTTGLVLVVVAVTKFLGGAWIVLLAIPLLVILMRRVHGHYQRVGLQLRAGVLEEEAVRPLHVCLVVKRVDEAAARALSYAQAINPASITVFALKSSEALTTRWANLAPDVPLRVVASLGDRGAVDRLRETLASEAARHPNAFTAALVAETLSSGWLDQVRHHLIDLRIKGSLLGEGDLVVTDFASPEAGPGPYTLEEPAEHHVVVLVSSINRATMRALAYARGLQPTSLRALSINLDTARSVRILQDWQDWDIRVPLEVVDSPFRSITLSLREYVRSFEPDGRRVIVTCVLPEFVLPHWFQQPLHNQTALLIKGALLFERGVVTTSVPYHVPDPDEVPAEFEVDAGRTLES
ncbi:MAG: amino acid permease [Nitriliruptorales bacterium]|nr:amino acid permease [Nitriliruptorales bacterium]